MKPELSIIILNFNTAKKLLDLLYSIQNFFPAKVNEGTYEVIIADNNSTERIIEDYVEIFPQYKFIFFERNDGFSSGNNKAVNYSKGKYLLFLNPDTRLIDNSLEKFITYYEKSDNIGILSGLLVDENMNPIYCYNNFPSYMWELYQMIGFGYGKKIEILLNKQEIKQNREFEVDWFHGAFIFLSRDDFDKIGGFNENYFMYCEDVELCFKIKRILKKKNICIPQIRIYHLTRSTIRNNKNDDIYYFHMFRGKLLFNLNYNFFKRNILKILIMSNVILRIIILPFWKKYKDIKKYKLIQLIVILKMIFSNNILYNSKHKYINI